MARKRDSRNDPLTSLLDPLPQQAQAAPAAGREEPVARFDIHMPPELRAAIRVAARREGISMNDLMVRTLADEFADDVEAVRGLVERGLLS